MDFIEWTINESGKRSSWVYTRHDRSWFLAVKVLQRLAEKFHGVSNVYSWKLSICFSIHKFFLFHFSSLNISTWSWLTVPFRIIKVILPFRFFPSHQINSGCSGNKQWLCDEQVRTNKSKDEQTQGRTDFGNNTISNLLHYGSLPFTSVVGSESRPSSRGTFVTWPQLIFV